MLKLHSGALNNKNLHNETRPTSEKLFIHEEIELSFHISWNVLTVSRYE